MTTADQIRAFADTGTPGPYWVADGSQWEVPVRAKDPRVLAARDALVQALGVTA